MGSLPANAVEDIYSLATRGYGVRAIARAMGVSKDTVTKYYPHHLDPRCPCGEPATHKGWCKHRYAGSTARQAFQAARGGRSVPLPPQMRVSRLTHTRLRKLRWLGAVPTIKCRPASVADMYGIVGVAKRLCRRVPREIRADVEQEVIVGVCCGNIYPSEIVSAMKFFQSRYWGYLFHGVSLDDLDPKMMDKKMFEGMSAEERYGHG